MTFLEAHKDIKDLAKLLTSKGPEALQVRFGRLISNEDDGTSTIDFNPSNPGESAEEGIPRLRQRLPLPGSLAYVGKLGTDYTLLGTIDEAAVDDSVPDDTITTEEVLTASAAIPTGGSGFPFLTGIGATGFFDWSHHAGDALMDLSTPSSPRFAADGTYGLTVVTNGFSDIVVTPPGEDPELDPGHITGRLVFAFCETRFPDNVNLVDMTAGSIFDLFILGLGLSGTITDPDQVAVLEEQFNNYSFLFHHQWIWAADDRIQVKYSGASSLASGSDPDPPDGHLLARMYIVKFR